MALPLLLPAIGTAGFAGSALANLYKQYRQRQLYDQLGKGYLGLHEGYGRYLARQGRRINPYRAVGSYYGQYLRSRTNSDISLASSVGTTAGTIGAGSLMGAKTWRYMR